MLKTYFKQAWTLLRQNKLFSVLYIAGTGLAIAMTMIMAVVYYVKIAPVYPEVNRLNMLYVSSASFAYGPEGHRSTYQWALSYRALQEWFYPLQNAEAVSANERNEYYIQPADRSGDFAVEATLTDPAFFRIYRFRFLDGKPFTEADWQSGIYTAVITDELARRLFGTTDGVVGRTFSMNYVDYRVCGVVQAASYLTRKSYAQVYAPYTSQPGYDALQVDELPYLGKYNVTFLVKDGAQADALRAEVHEIVRRENAAHPEAWTVDFWQQPTSHVVSVFQRYANQEFNGWNVAGQLLLVLLVLLLVPALNLSGMIASRMEGRLPEMGVRKSFGAGRRVLLGQVMWENLLLTLLGGIVGLLTAWLVLYVGREWVFTVLDEWVSVVPPDVDVRVSGEMLFAPLVFVAALLLCLALNLLSAFVPAWHALRRPIVQSLNEKL